MIYADHSKEKTVLCGYFSEDSDVDKDFYLEVDTAEDRPHMWIVYLCNRKIYGKISMFGRPKSDYTPQGMLDITSEKEINDSIEYFKRCFLGE